ncbi:hypothetical protein TNCV_4680071 [Trichonephila clavipes]|nr:hypothetical protein TNCV_4680071 [Trichonephila clavipes]
MEGVRSSGMKKGNKSNANTDGRRTAERLKTNPVYWGYELKRRQPMPVLLNATDKFRGLIGRIAMTDHHRIWGHKTCLVGEDPDNSTRGEDDEPNAESGLE